MKSPLRQIDRRTSHLHACNLLGQANEYWLDGNKIRYVSLEVDGMSLDQATFPIDKISRAATPQFPAAILRLLFPCGPH
jgi:hypothetical protein